MQIIEIRTLKKRDEKYIRSLQYKGKLKRYINKFGYACYDADELKQVEATIKMGRPLKKVDNLIEVDDNE